MKRPLLQIENLTAGYNGKQAIHHISLSVCPGEIVGIVGGSGSGKTTLLNCILGLEKRLRIDSGTIFYQSRELLTESRKERNILYGKEIAAVFQNSSFALVPTRRIQEQFYETMHASGLSKREVRQKAYALFERFDLHRPEDIFRSYSFQLSLGMAQRVAVSLALMQDPKLLLCDEPTSSLDAKNEYELIHQLELLKKEREMTMIVITHNIALAHHLCDRIAVMYQGEIVETGETKQLLLHPQHPYTKQLLQALPAL